MAKLWALADIHLSFQTNRDEWNKLERREEDGLILAGDGMSSTVESRAAPGSSYVQSENPSNTCR